MKQMNPQTCVCPQCNYKGDQSEFIKGSDDTAKNEQKGMGLEVYIGRDGDSENEQDQDNG